MSDFKAIERNKDIGSNHSLLMKGLVPGIIYGKGTITPKNKNRTQKKNENRNAIKKINESTLDQLVVTDTIPLSKEAENCEKIRVMTLAPTLAEAIRRINKEQSISAMMR